MKTQIRPDDVRFGTVQQTGKKTVIIAVADGRQGQPRRLFLSHLRRAEAEQSTVLFATGQKREINNNDKVAYIPRGDDFCLWVLKDEYDDAVNACLQTSTPAL